MTLRPSTRADLDYITALERRDDNREHIGQWSDWEHLSAIDRRNGREHWIIERDSTPAGYLIAYDCRAKDAGIYVKRILVADKEKGTGSEALRRFIDFAFSRDGVSCVWLLVRKANARGRHVYDKLGFEYFEPEPEEARRYDAFESPPGEGVLRMRLARKTSTR
ncbi:MAG TPA: GNAT family N-acetyltransferase [Usitatibacter sp.]|nr:GNAT family N-acetyltransferase [Usitatibacter sp.]